MSRHILPFALLAAIFGAPAPGLAEVPLVIHSRIYNFPGQQLCQVDRNDRRYREFCAPQSYHPYGAGGYRPYGTYRPVRRARPYLLAPNARIIRIPPSTSGGPDGG